MDSVFASPLLLPGLAVPFISLAPRRSGFQRFPPQPEGRNTFYALAQDPDQNVTQFYWEALGCLLFSFILFYFCFLNAGH